ncbi:MAG: 4Fe-4S ferredoxin, partial [Firmicutes bacterium]|nr:4Fe-4S ferredoxin [Candidatus Caballimonas caccae]
MLKIEKSKLKEVYSKIAEKMDLYLPLFKAGEVNYGKFDGKTMTSVETLKTVKSAKDFFFPQSETMMKFRLEGKNIEINDIRSDKELFVIFGVKACDYKSFEILDNVFLQEPVDTFYKSRRDAGIIVTLACSNPELSCFCKLFKIDASNPMG